MGRASPAIARERRVATDMMLYNQGIINLFQHGPQGWVLPKYVCVEFNPASGIIPIWATRQAMAKFLKALLEYLHLRSAAPFFSSVT